MTPSTSKAISNPSNGSPTLPLSQSLARPPLSPEGLTAFSPSLAPAATRRQVMLSIIEEALAIVDSDLEDNEDYNQIYPSLSATFRFPGQDRQ